MTRWRIELRDARGERVIGTLVVQAANLEKVKQHAERVYRRHLSGSADVYLEPRGHRTYCLILGDEEIGQAKITCLELPLPGVPHALRVLERERLRTRGAVGRFSCRSRRGTEPVPHAYRMVAERR